MLPTPYPIDWSSRKKKNKKLHIISKLIKSAMVQWVHFTCLPKLMLIKSTQCYQANEFLEFDHFFFTCSYIVTYRACLPSAFRYTHTGLTLASVYKQSSALKHSLCCSTANSNWHPTDYFQSFSWLSLHITTLVHPVWGSCHISNMLAPNSTG